MPLLATAANPDFYDLFQQICLIGTGFVLTLIAVQTILAAAQMLLGPKMRRTINQSMHSTPKAAATGIVFGIFTGSASTLGYILIPLLQAKQISRTRSLIAQEWACIGSHSLMVIAGLGISALQGFFMGILGLIYFLRFPKKWVPYVGIPVGVGILLFGMNFISDTALEISKYPFFSDFIALTSDVPLLAVAAGLLLTVATQTALGISLTLMALGAQGALTFPVIFLFQAGISVGYCLNGLLKIGDVRGDARTQRILPILVQIALSTLFVVDYYLEIALGLPLMIRLIESLFAGGIYQQFIANVVLGSIIRTTLFSLFAKQFFALYDTYYPWKGKMDLATPQFVVIDQEPRDYRTALDLIENEYRQLTERLPIYLEIARTANGKQIGRLTEYHEGFLSIRKAVLAFYAEAVGLASNRLDRGRGIDIATRFRALENLESLIYSLTQGTLEAASARNIAWERRLKFIESIDIMILTLIDVMRRGDPEDLALLETLTDDKKMLISEMRDAYFAKEHALQITYLDATVELLASFERATTLIRSIAGLKPLV